MGEELKTAVLKNNMDEVRRIISADKDSALTKEELSESLILACEKGHLKMIAYLLTVKGVDVNYREKKKRVCALMAAIKKQQQEAAELILKQPNVDIYSADRERTNVVMQTARMAYPDLVKVMIEKMRKIEGGDDAKFKEMLNKTDDRGYSAIQWATCMFPLDTDVDGRKLKTVKVLHEAGIDINHQDNKNRTALMRACLFGYVNIVKYLLEQDEVMYNLKDILNCTALMSSKTDEIEELFLSKYGILKRKNDLDMSGFEQFKLNRAADHGNLVKVKKYLAEGKVNVNFQDHLQRTPLYLAIIKGGHLEVVKELLKQDDINVNLKSNYIKTPLMRAIEDKYDDIAYELLAKEGIDVNIRDNYGQTALIMAVKRNRKQLVQRMINLPDINLNKRDNNGRTALVHAYNKGYMEIVEHLMLHESVRNKLHLTYVDGELNRAIIAAVGMRNKVIWNLLLCTAPERVLALLVLMAAEIKSERTEDQTEFWKYVFDHKEAQKYLRGDVADQKGNTLFHYCAKAECEKHGTNLLKLLPMAYFDNLDEKVNQNGDTILHAAMKSNRTSIFHEIIDRFDQYSKYHCLWVDKILVVKNKAENTFLSIAMKSENISDEDIEKMMVKIKGIKMDQVCKTYDRDKNTLLHLATMHSRHELVPYLITKQLGFRKKNLAGLMALHMAVRNNDLLTIGSLYKGILKRGLDINERTSEGETAMHIAAKLGLTKMIKQLVEFGGHLDIQDTDGNTPLHDVLQMVDLVATEEDEDRMKVFHATWKTMVEICVIWWCKRKFIPVPDEDSEYYTELSQDAMYYLRSGIPNNNVLTVLEYAAALGLSECVHIMLTERSVFVRMMKETKPDCDENKDSTEDDKKPIYEIEVSNLMPEYFHQARDDDKPNTNKCDKPPDVQKMRSWGVDKDKETDQEKTEVLPKTDSTQKADGDEEVTFSTNVEEISTFLDTLSKVKPPSKVSDVLETFPMELLGRHQWYIYQMLFVFYFLIHTSIMIWYTYASQTVVKRLNDSDSNGEPIGAQTQDVVLVVYSVLLVVVMGIYYIFHRVTKKGSSKRSQLDDSDLFEDYVEAKGAILNLLTYAVALIAEQLNKIIGVTFVFGSILLLILSREADGFTPEHYAWLKGIVIFCGWMIVLIIGRAYSPIYNFVIALKYIFVKDMVPFLLFFVILTVAFGCAIQLQFQLLSPETVEDQSALWLVNFLTSAPQVVWELAILTSGMDAEIMNVQNVGNMFKTDQYRTFYVELLLFLYGLAAIVILLNMLIAAMSETYLNVIAKQGKGWRQFQVKNAIRLRRLTFGVFDKAVRRVGEAKQDPKSLRWYMPMSHDDLKDIRAKYWISEEPPNEDDGNDNEDDMKSKLHQTAEKVESLLQHVETLRQKDEERQKKMDSVLTLAEQLLTKQTKPERRTQFFS